MKESVLVSGYSFLAFLSDSNATGTDLHIRFPSAAELVIMGREGTYLQSGCTLAEISRSAVEELELTSLSECPEIISALQGRGREFSELLWMLAYSQAEDFHRQQCKKTDVYRLSSWPNLTRLPHKESFVNIASLLMHRAHSCKIVSSMLRIPLDEVFLFCSCATAAGYLQTATTAAQEDSLQVLPERKSSLISSILSRLQSRQGEKMEHKIIFTGTVGAGKSQAISTISDIEVVSTEAEATDETAEKKDLTTVAMDYGVMNLEGGQRLHLYGTPGQERFSFMWDILTLGGLGLVILIDNAIEDPLENVRLYLNAFSEFIEKNPVVIGVTHMDVKASPRLSDYREVVASLNVKAPVMEVDSRCSADVKTLLITLVTQIQYRAE